MEQDFHVGLPWRLEDSPLDVMSYDTALEQLLRARVVSEDDLMDYGVNQALRSLCFAVKSFRRPLKPELKVHTMSSLHSSIDSTKAVWVSGRAAVFDSMCRLAVADPRYLSTISYLSKRLLCDQASSFGQGNERPCCTKEWTQTLLLDRTVIITEKAKDIDTIHRSRQYKTESYFSSQFNIHRRAQLGYLWMFAATLRIIAIGSAERSHLFTDHLTLVKGIIDEVLPHLSKLANISKYYHLSSLVPHTSHALLITEPNPNKAALPDVSYMLPSRLMSEANHFIIHCVYWLSTDVLVMYKSLQNKSQTVRKVLDRDAPLMLWRTVSLVRDALLRGFSWIQIEMDSIHLKAQNAMRSPVTLQLCPSSKMLENSLSSFSKNISSSIASNSETEFVVQVCHHLRTTITKVLKKQEELDCTRTAAAKKYGMSSKDYNGLSEIMWANTIQLCLMLQGLTRSWMLIHGGLGLAMVDSSFMLVSNKDIVGYIASCIASIPSFDDSKGGSAHLAQAYGSLLSALIALAAAAPLRRMQAEVWVSDPDSTRKIHGALVQRVLRCPDDDLQGMASLLTESMLYSTSKDLSTQFTSDVSDHFLNTLVDSRDAVSHYAIKMLTIAVLQRPYIIIPSLFRMLERGNSQTRRNVLDVLACLPKHMAVRSASATESKDGMSESVLPNLHSPDVSSSTAQDNMREVLRLLAANLLSRLHDEELVVRMQSAALFSKVWPEDVLEPLLNLFLKKDSTGRSQSVIKASLGAVMLSHTDNAEIVLLLLQEAFCALHSIDSFQGVDLDGKALVSSVWSTLPSPSQRKRKTPVTPGDILTHALLYTRSDAEDRDASECPMESSEKVTSHSNPRQGKDPKASATSSIVLKEERVGSLVKSLCREWAHSVKKWTIEGHLNPLMRFLVKISGSSPEAQRWYLRNLMSLFSYLTSQRHSVDGPVLLPSPIMLQAIDSVFFTTRSSEQKNEEVLTSGQTNSTEAVSPVSLGKEMGWIDSIRDFVKNKLITGSATTSQGICMDYQTLLPLFCLNSCSRKVFIPLSNPSDSLPLANVSTCSSEDGFHKEVLEKIWHILWTALTDEVCLPFWEKDNKAIHLLLTVLCNYPATRFFPSIEIENLSDTRTLNFFSRVFVFGFCHYSNNFIGISTSHQGLSMAQKLVSGENKSWSQTQNSKVDTFDHQHIWSDMQVCLNSVSRLDYIFRTLVLPWLMDQRDELEESSDRESAYSKIQRLCFSTLDAWGLLTLTFLLDNELAKSIWPLCAKYTYNPLCNLADFYRHKIQKVEYKTQASASLGCLPKVSKETAESDRAMALICIQINSKALEYLNASHNISRNLLLGWFKCYLPPLIELANADCARDEAGGAPHYAEALNCAQLVCKAAILTAKYLKNVALSSNEDKLTDVTPTKAVGISLCNNLDRSDNNSLTSAEPFSCFLEHLPLSDREALVNFALGCARFRKSLEIQSIGVRLLVLLLSEATEILASSSSDSSTNLLDATQLTLREFSLIHPDKHTRELAEFALHTFEC